MQRTILIIIGWLAVVLGTLGADESPNDFGKNH
ncbi:hypothetical protein SEEA9517_06930 [Salmonella enterica subsp. enterica serovar Agona str. 400095 17]|nr:hypothetical protein SEEACDC5_13633 [Salmonella enterica subsp. enterica serovar Agona str. SA-5]ESB85420.1 hypothetical protein SEEACDC4_04190 [Salmonella enterica subsp. enterica serovar Agona str. SA-4]ESC25198.1 hypothetical protein SEEACDC1_11295 [Salmonella enterica subsp. enterica serovar Agona str. SA-1]ESC29646.1 hypothetical protein SEEACDC2_02346 [Salmonella enterica subsp. enterica serovar Agona str. SA-2]ESC29783.1 hypothetical protein SEEACDC3_13324 [Salmonella enterica subsp. 